ncbi:hypothetical protein C2845_PM01G43670 [Panicum miliaceum]|uniref:Uncharacterized protein n=1 Tax=Panicum miliaceum TaxID=4540 RepID=A0A3L6TT16_PANMI|nr:hypothetical protein C2845_PM01G43670 [Panicum miliaceum]
MCSGAGVTDSSSPKIRPAAVSSPASLSFFPFSLSFLSLRLSRDWVVLPLNFPPPKVDFTPAPQFPAPLDFPRDTHLWRPPLPLGRPNDAYGRIGGRLELEADTIGILARRGGRHGPRARLDA